MMALTPSTTTYRGELDDGVQWDFNRHTLFNSAAAKIGHEALEDTHVAHNKRRDDFLLDIDDDAV